MDVSAMVRQLATWKEKQVVSLISLSEQSINLYVGRASVGYRIFDIAMHRANAGHLCR